jgi:truncated hemoglobin YjbI
MWEHTYTIRHEKEQLEQGERQLWLVAAAAAAVTTVHLRPEARAFCLGCCGLVASRAEYRAKERDG